MQNWQEALMDWYMEFRRDLPWRYTRDPYKVWISEIMLQQTRVDTVMEYYQRFLRDFPTVQKLAEASLDQVLKDWEGLGYYSRARNLMTAAGQVAKSGKFPDTLEEIRALKGIGDYTAAAIYSIAYRKKCAAVDGNVLRVISRLYGMKEDIATSSAKEHVRRIVLEHAPDDGPGWDPNHMELKNMASEKDPAAYTQSLMELGALVCLPGNPRCGDCPLQKKCIAKRDGQETILPIKKAAKEPIPEEKVIWLVLRRETENSAYEQSPFPSDGQREGFKVLMHRRAPQGLLAGLWEYPEKETAEKWLAAEKNKMLSCRNSEENEEIPVKYLFDAEHVFSHRIWKMKVYRIDIQTGLEIAEDAEGSEEWCWADVQKQEEMAIPTAFRKIRMYLRKNA